MLKFAGILLALWSVPVSMSAKGAILRITVTGDDLTAPVMITDRGVISRFKLQEGPGTFQITPDGETIENYFPQGFLVDWSQGPVQPPDGVRSYEVSFVTERPGPNQYKVRYAVDPSTSRCYVYFPGKTDPEYADDVWIITRGIEGQWFRAWTEWEKVANPLIEEARKLR